MSSHFRQAATLVAAALLAACGGDNNSDAPRPDLEREVKLSSVSKRDAASSVAALALPGRGAASIPAARGVAPAARGGATLEVWVRLDGAPLALRRKELRPDGHWRSSDGQLRVQLQTHLQLLRQRQNETLASITAMGGVEAGRVTIAHNAVAVRVPAARVPDIERLPGVTAVRAVKHYSFDLASTVPYVGAAAAQAAGKDGTGAVVAVLDSGIDYTHRNMGGAGTAEAYAAAWGAAVGDPKQTTRDGLFPTAKVIGGFDFVGEAWPTTGDRTEDEDPIDLEGHGTHVADIVAGIGPNKGVAPGAKLLAVKVCSAVASSCNGVALLKGVDFALDPNGDGDLSDAVDVMNLSLGSSYGQDEDDLSFALSNAVKLGVSVVASAGNSGNRPFITGSPASATGVLSVAQTQVPSAAAFPLVVNSPASIAGRYVNTNTAEWAPIGAGFTGDVRVTGSPAANNLACNPLPAGSLAGYVALIDRGTCSISVKVHNAANAGAIGVLLANNAPGDPPSFSFGGPTPFNPAPMLVLTQTDGNRIRTALATATVNVSVSPAFAIDLVGSMVSTSSRGPGFSTTALKPEIGAPGASLSAEATTGTGETVFGGTSGAAPMVAGGAAILRAQYPDRTPEQIKAMLMNSANTVVYNNPATEPGVLAPISRIGAGELRVDRALALTTIAYDRRNSTAALPFGFAEVGDRERLESQLTIENLGAGSKTYSISASYRYPNDAASGATTLEFPDSVTVTAGSRSSFAVRMQVDGTKLPAWGLNGGALGGSGALLEANEVDGYLTIRSGDEVLTVPFHALLRKSAELSVSADAVRAGNDVRIRNRGVHEGAFDVFALTGTSERFPRSERPDPGDNFALVDLRAVGVRQVSVPGAADFVQFAVSRYDRRAHPAYPAGIEIYIDSNNDGVDDWVVFNQESGGAFAADGRTIVGVQSLTATSGTAVTFLDADLLSANGIFTVPLSAVGLTPGQTFRFSVLVGDNYFTGLYTDAIENMTFTLDKPRYAIAVDSGELPAASSVRIPTSEAAGGAQASPSQSGFLVLYRQNLRSETDIVQVQP